MFWIIVCITCWSAMVNCQMSIDPPADLEECFKSITLKTRTLTSQEAALTSPDEIQLYCLQQFLWAHDKVKWSEYNVTQKQIDMVNLHLRSLMKHGRRTKRWAGPTKFPATGFRIRQEYRRLNWFARTAFHKAVNDLKLSGEYDVFAAIHTGIAVASAHNGANFLGWHRVYLAVVEEALRKYNPFVSIPYWDSSMDFDMLDPTNSIIWSEELLGNGDGFVTTGPFANWLTPPLLARNIGGLSSLISKEVIWNILTRCETAEIVTPTAVPMYNLEFAHNGVHSWVGGQMGGTNTAPEDPVFFLHHAFIDYIWELFRIRQAFVCNINPETNYPTPSVVLHEPDRIMEGFAPHRNIDGYSNRWTMFWYRYERSPACSFAMPYCGSPFLWCDVWRGRCIAMARSSFGLGAAGASGGRMGYGGRVGPSTTASRLRGEMEAATIPVGPRFIGPPSDGRSLRGGKRGRFRRAAPENNRHNAARNETNKETLPFQFGPSFLGSSVGIRPTSRTDMTMEQATRMNPRLMQQNPFSVNLPLLPIIDFSIVHNKAPDSQHQSTMNVKENENDMKAFISVQVIYRHQPKSGYTASSFRQRHVVLGSSSTYQSSFTECKQHPSGTSRVTVQSNGINYMGMYSNAIEFDSRLPNSTRTTYVRINAPSNGVIEVMLSAFHECGLMCQPACPTSNVNPLSSACTGILQFAEWDKALIYGPTLEEALSTMQERRAAESLNQQPRISFQCSNADVSPWSLQAYSPILNQ